VARTITDNGEVSTVFLGLDHGFAGPTELPILFETLVFGGTLDGETKRCCTWPQAEKQHAEMVRRVKRARKKGV